MVQNEAVILLYLFMMSKLTMEFRLKIPLWKLAILHLLLYLLITFISDTSHLFHPLTLFMQLILFIWYISFHHYLKRIIKENIEVKEENHHLFTHDALTGLLNFASLHQRLNRLIERDTRFVLLFIDCTNLKSLNMEQGFEGVNHLLKDFSNQLTKLFPEAYCIARYGGDEFAVVLRVMEEDDLEERLAPILESETPMIMGMPITYGYTLFPEEADNKQELITITEQKLFLMKRANWLKREEDMQRSEKLRVVGELAAGMAHEIRNPLTAIKGFVQIAKSNSYQIEPWYGVIMAEINRINQLTSEFLQFSKPAPKNFRLCTLQECVDRVHQLTLSQAVYLGHELVIQPALHSLEVCVDKDKIVQVILNLVKNGLDAMEANGILTIRLGEKNGKGMVEIADTGRGMTKEETEKIFHPFYTTKEEGTGLGLPISYKIIQDHDGDLEVESELGVGTTFRLYLPLIKTKDRGMLQEEGS